jgi:outer membrane lipoprotein-sorting protein
MGHAGDASRRVGRYMGGMNMLTALFAPLAAIVMALPAHAEIIPLSDLSRYLNGLTTAESDFTQVNADGSISTGRLYIRRPGRARFEYAPPDRSLVLAGGGQVAIFDAKSNQPPEQYPLRRTPLNLILAEDVDLGRAEMVVGHGEVENTTRVVAQDPENPEYGTIELVFTADPVELRQWIITDDLGSQTTVILGEMIKGGDIPASLFNITFEIERRGN